MPQRGCAGSATTIGCGHLSASPVFREWHGWHSGWRLSRSSVPPRDLGVMWSTSVAGTTWPCVRQCLHSGSSARTDARRALHATPYPRWCAEVRSSGLRSRFGCCPSRGGRWGMVLVGWACGVAGTPPSPLRCAGRRKVLAHLDPMARLSRFRPQGFGPVGWLGAFTACWTAARWSIGGLAPAPRL